MNQQFVMCKQGRRDLDEGDVVPQEKLKTRQIPHGGSPIDRLLSAVLVNIVVLVRFKLNLVPVLQVAHPAPGRFAHDILLMLRDGDRGSPLLKFDTIPLAREDRVDQTLGSLEVSIVVDANLAN